MSNISIPFLFLPSHSSSSSPSTAIPRRWEECVSMGLWLPTTNAALFSSKSPTAQLPTTISSLATESTICRSIYSIPRRPGNKYPLNVPENCRYPNKNKQCLRNQLTVRTNMSPHHRHGAIISIAPKKNKTILTFSPHVTFQNDLNSSSFSGWLNLSASFNNFF